MQNEVKKLYKKIIYVLKKSVPENAQSVYLYASVMHGRNGEMFFYYFPKGLIKTRPINCYDIPQKFDVDETKYTNNLKILYNYIQILNNITGRQWTNITIIIKDGFFTIEYHFNDIIHSKYTDEQRRKVWCHQYLGMSIENMSVSDEMLIRNYVEETKIKPSIYTEAIDQFDDDLIAEEIAKDTNGNGANIPLIKM